MIKNSSGAAGSKGLRQPIHRRGTLQSLVRPMTVAILALGITVAVCPAEAQHSHEAAQEHGVIESVQTECPVMVGNKIDPSIYTDYQGKRFWVDIARYRKGRGRWGGRKPFQMQALSQDGTFGPPQPLVKAAGI